MIVTFLLNGDIKIEIIKHKAEAIYNNAEFSKSYTHKAIVKIICSLLGIPWISITNPDNNGFVFIVN